MPATHSPPPHVEGFTLIELMISLLLFALIAVAGLALVDSVLGVEGRTGVRLDRLSDLQRTMLVVSADVEQVARGDVSGGGSGIVFTRAAPGIGGPPLVVRYSLVAGTLVRDTGAGPQRLLTGVGTARWRFYGEAWTDRWPLSEAQRGAWPRAVELYLTLQGVGAQGELRRVVLLPTRAQDVT